MTTIDPATLNRRLTLRRYTSIDGDWGPEYTWTDLRTVWAAMAYDSTDETFAADQLYAERVVTFTVRFTTDLTAQDRVACMDVEYEILGISEIGNRDGLAIKAKAFDPGGA